MRLEYLPDGSPDCPILRLSHFTPAEASRLAAALLSLAAGDVQQVAVHAMPGITAISDCELVLRRRSWDQALVRVGPSAFECGLTPGTWDDVAGLIEAFAAGGGGNQWLVTTPGEASLLLSACGQW